MKNIICATTLIIAATFSSVSLAKNADTSSEAFPTSVNAFPTSVNAFPTSVNDQITDSVTQFKSYDLNSDGKISLAEAKAAGLSDVYFKKADTNGDHHIDEKEYMVALVICC